MLNFGGIACFTVYSDRKFNHSTLSEFIINKPCKGPETHEDLIKNIVKPFGFDEWESCTYAEEDFEKYLKQANFSCIRKWYQVEPHKTRGEILQTKDDN